MTFHFAAWRNPDFGQVWSEPFAFVQGVACPGGGQWGPMVGSHSCVPTASPTEENTGEGLP